MFPTINKRFLILLIAITAGLTGVLFGAHAVQERRIPDALKQQAERAAEQAKGEPKKADLAVHYFRQYLEFRPDDVEAEERLTDLIQERKRPTDAESTRRLHGELLRHYDRILRVDGARHETRRKAVKSSLLLARYTDAETHTKALLKEFPNEQATWLDLAFAQKGLNQAASARESYEQAIKVDPNKQSAYQEYAEYLANDLKLKDEAKAVLDRLVKALPNEAESFNARGRFLSSVGNETAAVADARTALALDPKSADAMILLGEQLQKRREGVMAAADTFREGMKLHPTDPRFIRNLAWLELNRGNSGIAVATLEDGMTRVNERESFDLIVSLVDLLLEMRDLDRARELIGKLEGRVETNSSRKRTAEQQAVYVRARLAMSEQRWGDAVAGFTQLRRGTADNVTLECQVNLLLALCHQRKGEFEQEEETLKLILSRDPNHASARRTLGDAYLNAGRFDEAITEYEQAAKNRFATADCRAKLLRMKATRLRTSGAGNREWSDLDAQLAQYEPTFGSSTSEYAMIRGELLSARGAFDRAYAVLRTEAMKRPSDATLWARTAMAATDLAGVSVGLSILDEAQAVCGDRTALRLARANLYARDPARLRPLHPLALQIDTWPEGEQVKLLYGLINAFEQVGDDAGVLRTYRRLAGRYPSDTAVWEGLFDRAARTGDEKTGTEARQMLTKYSTDRQRSEALLNAVVVASQKNVSEADVAAANLVNQFGASPDRADVCIALARLHVLSGNTASAEVLYTRAMRLEPVRFGPVLEYLTHLTSAGQYDLLSQFIGRLSQDYRWRGDPLRRVVQQTIVRVEPSTAKRLLDSVRPAVEIEPGGIGWLGDCYRTVGLQTEANQCYQRAVSVGISTSDDWLRLAVRTGESSDPASAIRVLTGAKTRLNSPQLFLMVAALFAETPIAPNGWEPELPTATERKQYVQARLSVKLSRYLKDEAIAILENYLADKRTLPADAGWARRNLAMMLAARGNGTDRTRAKELLTGDDTTSGETVDDKRAAAAVMTGLSKQIEGNDGDQLLLRAIRVLGEVASESKNKRDRFLLSQLYRTAANRRTGDAAKEDRAKSRRLLNELIREDRRNIEYYIAALDDATEPDDQDDAEKCAGYLIGNHASDFRVVQAVARYECRSNRPEKALTQIVAYTRTADSHPGDLQDRTRRAAELLDELGRRPTIRGTAIGRRMTAVAVELYEGLFGTRPEVMVAIAGLLSNDGRPDEAFAKIEKHGKSLPPRVKVLAGLAVLRACVATDAQFGKVQEWLDVTKTEEPGSVDVLMNEGEYYALRRDTGAAERAYQAVLEIDDQHVVALNNLAWIIATRPEASERAFALIERAVRVIGLTDDLLETRARVSMAKAQYSEAERDLTAATKKDSTALRLFLFALIKQKVDPEKTSEINAIFREAKERGLREVHVHPADIEVYRSLSKAVGSAE